MMRFLLGTNYPPDPDKRIGFYLLVLEAEAGSLQGET
jgi:hypothetical protein